ncbi:acyl carrier protein [Paenibacillus psychroresistens]|uniref:Acyl carrier protein n=1 Tax=Paenibacillus psychroresistens TaxID=1778678 RepID=A0A6B8RQ29_9BACL|nr:phosphopantetheine-binding protein [Paenibacillus psychroresistens]QGQ98481.1 acyl carrier protein [Paenibacillus psychroresistens]
MKKIELLNEIKEILQVDMELTDDMKLEEIEDWDSLAIVSVISLFDLLLSVNITSQQVNNCRTIQDLLNLTNGKLE